MSNRPKSRFSKDDKLVWRAVAQTVTALPGRRVPDPEDDAEPALPASAPAFPPAFLPAPAPAPAPKRALPDLVAGLTHAMDRRNGDRLVRGEMEIDGRLDLHGMTQDAAHRALMDRVVRAHDVTGQRCLLVITGKGTRPGSGVLKAMVPRWLNQSPCRERVLAFSAARPRDGGDGALYVMIKRRR